MFSIVNSEMQEYHIYFEISSHHVVKVIYATFVNEDLAVIERFNNIVNSGKKL